MNFSAQLPPLNKQAMALPRGQALLDAGIRLDNSPSNGGRSLLWCNPLVLKTVDCSREATYANEHEKVRPCLINRFTSVACIVLQRNGCTRGDARLRQVRYGHFANEFCGQSQAVHDAQGGVLVWYRSRGGALFVLVE